jgi:hypothetical protein
MFAANVARKDPKQLIWIESNHLNRKDLPSLRGGVRILLRSSAADYFGL